MVNPIHQKTSWRELLIKLNKFKKNEKAYKKY